MCAVRLSRETSYTAAVGAAPPVPLIVTGIALLRFVTEGVWLPFGGGSSARRACSFIYLFFRPLFNFFSFLLNLALVIIAFGIIVTESCNTYLDYC